MQCSFIFQHHDPSSTAFSKPAEVVASEILHRMVTSDFSVVDATISTAFSKPAEVVASEILHRMVTSDSSVVDATMFIFKARWLRVITPSTLFSSSSSTSLILRRFGTPIFAMVLASRRLRFTGPTVRTSRRPGGSPPAAATVLL
ncbi:hypothetical protein B0H13DRAFT_1879286 [Mycena leptocephala]|nr:hypothetical protein B0H13DRAFT_1879286 [Mycena leptocephala]